MQTHQRRSGRKMDLQIPYAHVVQESLETGKGRCYQEQQPLDQKKLEFDTIRSIDIQARINDIRPWRPNIWSQRCKKVQRKAV